MIETLFPLLISFTPIDLRSDCVIVITEHLKHFRKIFLGIDETED